MRQQNSESPISKDGSAHITDERINTITHLVAACLALPGGILLVLQAGLGGDLWKSLSLFIYSLSVIALFTFSTLHHGLHGNPKLNKILRTFDYNAVFFLTAGTVTPLVVVFYPNAFGWSVLAAVWLIAALGITLRSVYAHLPKYITNTLYIVLGWMPVILLGGGSLPSGALLLLALGGIAYSIGFIIYVIEKPNPIPGLFGFHEIWHILVFIAALTHYFMMYLYILPA